MSERICSAEHEHDAAGCLDCACNYAPSSVGYADHLRYLGAVGVLDEMRSHGTGPTLYYAQRLADALGEPAVLTPEVLASGRLSR